MGGGFGGCTINIVQEEAVDNFIEQASTAYKKQFDIALEAYAMEVSDGVGRIND
jgi:galactokinase